MLITDIKRVVEQVSRDKGIIPVWQCEAIGRIVIGKTCHCCLWSVKWTWILETSR